MAITSKLLFSRLSSLCASTSLINQSGSQLDELTLQRIRETVNHSHMPAGFVAENDLYFIELINSLVDYIETLKRPHALIRTGKASPSLMLSYKRGELKDKGITLLPPTVGISACYDDSDTLKYYSITKGA